jgi:hypothetical protein
MRNLLFALALVLASVALCSADDIVNEKSSWTVTVSFFDETGAPATPTSITYRIDDVRSGMSILASTQLSPVGPVNTIVITPAQNTMRDSTKTYEARRLTIIWLYGGNKQGTAEYLYQIKHLPKVN